MSKIRYNPETPLYTSDERAWRIGELGNVLDSLHATGQPVVLFVHGRGKEPNKSLRGATFAKGLAVHKIERGYGVRVLMFNWDSAFKGWNFLDREVPIANTEAGAIALGQVLRALQHHQTQGPESGKPAMLVHSMGSIVVQKAVLNGHWPQVKGLFSRVLLSQPDADDVGHTDWMQPLAEREKVYVTLNRDDKVLQRSTDVRPDGRHALGLDTSEPLAPAATYVDLTNMGVLGQKDDDHEVFGKGAMNGQLHVCQFFENALTGKPVKLQLGANVERIDRQVVYRLASRNEPGAPCLKQPTLPGDHDED
jgi:esterase/lipase superfamily enzyme